MKADWLRLTAADSNETVASSSVRVKKVVDPAVVGSAMQKDNSLAETRVETSKDDHHDLLSHHE
jgi:hypothetical protein